MEFQCYCGHAHDEHDERGVKCEVDGCPCIQFESNPDEPL